MSKSAESVTVLERLKSGRASINEVRQEFDLTELGDEEANRLLSMQLNHISDTQILLVFETMGVLRQRECKT
ncbi:hypothetical protein ERICI_01299 [Paenibacillus larvae subsp. larvae]|uniref:Uncharacterized protein n=5 Tax=root TaxID=1 RepID=A0A0K2CZK0_9CAUD|nr:hypothetical protein [Paenibacillus larvae]YP_009196147.1 hypothetical protein VEGAS_48 [Paenibacillus phage Vegas]ALA12776.1 hypothetical protein HAYLEY_46 [Paenibacillus phage Hayley]ALA12863.1 hypothetical protein VADIM_48 [Paenibacillus phage Vadim]ALA12949.1 hypothetical protein DIANE_48 [Paenibacillus phage Diane]UYE92063.1 hypothetical protein LUNBUN_39 [Paenibacillus phage LunBun]UYE92145.1 hypothetical protein BARRYFOSTERBENICIO_39 [Paenibacillus phage BarryFoster_Benicio]UYL9150